MASEQRLSVTGTPVWRSAAALGLVVAMGTGLLVLVHELTRDRIAEQEQRATVQQLGEIVRTDRYDNALHEDRLLLRDPTAFPGDQTVTAYRARRGGEPVAIIFRLAAPDGYNGSIRLLVGIDYDGRISGVRVTSHKETPGLGDGIELARSPWVLAFAGRSLSDPEPERWTVAKNGGEFDQFTGATITPRAVITAVRRALVYFEENRNTLFDTPAEPMTESER